MFSISRKMPREQDKNTIFIREGFKPKLPNLLRNEVPLKQSAVCLNIMLHVLNYYQGKLAQHGTLSFEV